VVAKVDGELLAKNEGSLAFNAEKTTEHYTGCRLGTS